MDITRELVRGSLLSYYSGDMGQSNSPWDFFFSLAFCCIRGWWMFFKFFLYISCMHSPHLHAEIHTLKKMKLLNFHEISIFFNKTKIEEQ